MCSRAALEETSSWTMGTRSPDKRGSFFKVKEALIEIAQLQLAPFAGWAAWGAAGSPAGRPAAREACSLSSSGWESMP